MQIYKSQYLALISSMNHLAVARGPEDVADISDNQKLLDLVQDTVDINTESNMTTDGGAAISTEAAKASR